MALTFSTGLRTKILGKATVDTGSNGLRGIFDGYFISLYSGAQPSNADQAPTGTLLLTFSVNAGGSGAPLHFDAPVLGVISKAAAEVHKGLGIAAGTAGWFRLALAADAGTTNTSDPRIDGSVAVTGGDLSLSTTNIAIGTPVTIDTFQLTATFQ